MWQMTLFLFLWLSIVLTLQRDAREIKGNQKHLNLRGEGEGGGVSFLYLPLYTVLYVNYDEMCNAKNVLFYLFMLYLARKLPWRYKIFSSSES